MENKFMDRFEGFLVQRLTLLHQLGTRYLVVDRSKLAFVWEKDDLKKMYDATLELLKHYKKSRMEAQMPIAYCEYCKTEVFVRIQRDEDKEKVLLICSICGAPVDVKNTTENGQPD